MVTAFDLVSAIKTATVLEPMKIITHDRGVISPALIGYRQIVVTIKKTDPIPGFMDPRHADQFRTQTRNNDAKPVLFVSEYIQIPAVSFFLCVRKGHRSS